MILALTLAAYADSITLDSGATIEGDLARYEFGGDCQISVTEGELSGVILIVPCHRVEAFVRTNPVVPAPIGLTSMAPPSYAPARATPVAPVAVREVAPQPVAAAVVEAPAVAELNAEAEALPVTDTAPVAAVPAVEESAPVETSAVAPYGGLTPRPAPAMGSVDAEEDEAPEATPSRRPVSF